MEIEITNAHKKSLWYTYKIGEKYKVISTGGFAYAVERLDNEDDKYKDTSTYIVFKKDCKITIQKKCNDPTYSKCGIYYGYGCVLCPKYK